MVTVCRYHKFVYKILMEVYFKKIMKDGCNLF